jgi:phosphoglucosamine mutase
MKPTDPLADDHVKQAINDGESSLNGNGRVVIRKSGTEPLIASWSKVTMIL